MDLNKTNIAKGILVYYWILIGLLELNLPEIISADMQTWLTFGCLGFLAAKYMDNDIEEQLLYLQSMVDGPKVLTNWGAYNWDGVTYRESIDGDTYCILREGVSFMGQTVPGHRAFVCPSSHVAEVGKHRLIMSDLDWVTIDKLPEDIHNFTRGSLWTFKGDTISPIFGTPDPEQINLSKQNQNQVEYANNLAKTNAEYQKIISDTMMLLKNGQKAEDPDYKRLMQSINSMQTGGVSQ
jgi:hypothetical protein